MRITLALQLLLFLLISLNISVVAAGEADVLLAEVEHTGVIFIGSR